MQNGIIGSQLLNEDIRRITQNLAREAQAGTIGPPQSKNRARRVHREVDLAVKIDDLSDGQREA